MGNRIRTAPVQRPQQGMGLKGASALRVRNEALRGLQGVGHLVYAVRTGDGLIKIGCTSDIVRRLMAISGGTEEILAIKPGDFAAERAIHDRLKGHAAHGREYYFPTPSVLLVVNEMRTALGMDPVVIERRWAS